MELPHTHENPPEQSVVSPLKNLNIITLTEKASLYILFATLFLVPLAFIPSQFVIFDLVKTIVITLGVLVSTILYCISVAKRRNISLPSGKVAFVGISLVMSIIISSFLSSNISKSFFGQGFEIGSTSFLLVLFLSSLLVFLLVNKRNERVLGIYLTIFGSFVILALFQLLRLKGADFMSLGILNTVASSVIGKWFDFGIFAAMVGLLLFFSIKFLSLGRGLKILIHIFLVIIAFLLFIINSSFIWLSLALILLALGVYEFYSKLAKGITSSGIFSRISLVTLILFLVCAVFAWKGTDLSLGVIQKFKAEQAEVILPWQMTLDVASETIKESPLFGAGPNRFMNQYLKFKPLEINRSAFWNAEFGGGFSTLSTYVVTLGLVGSVLWLIFFIIFVQTGIKALKKSMEPLKKFTITSSFFTASFLWIINLIYSPSHVILFFTFVMTGIFFASQVESGLVSTKEIGLNTSPRASKFVFVCASIFLVICIVWLGMYSKKAIALSYFESGIKILSTEDALDKARGKFKKALAWDTTDIYYLALSETNIIKIQKLKSEVEAANATTSPDPKIVQEIKALVGESLGYVEKAIKIDSKNYYNFVAQARILEVATSLKIQDAYESAKKAYEDAIALNPYNPGLYLSLARLHGAQGQFAPAQEAIGRALQLRNNYIEAIFFLSQVQVANGEIKNALVSARVATEINPNEPILLFQLGILHYNDKNYIEAVNALSRAVTINPQYANARYFLGLSLVRLGKNAEAIEQFVEIQKTNEDNQEVIFILKNLREGKSPFADAPAPIDSKPEKRATLPVKEEEPVDDKSN